MRGLTSDRPRARHRNALHLAETAFSKLAEQYRSARSC